MLELTDKAAISLAFDYYTGLGFSIADSFTLIDILLKAKVGRLMKLAYEKGVEDTFQAVQQAQADRDLYDWKREIRR